MDISNVQIKTPTQPQKTPQRTPASKTPKISTNNGPHQAKPKPVHSSPQLKSKAKITAGGLNTSRSTKSGKNILFMWFVS